MEKSKPDDAEKAAQSAKRLGRPSKQSEATEDDLELERLSSTSPTASAHCRRSTRKKIIKFDVLDVLNKSRKNAKIQIEARIDSNAPTKPANVAASATTTSMNRLIATRPAMPPAVLPLPLPALEFSVKPKPTPSLIVAQVSSDKTLAANPQSTSTLSANSQSNATLSANPQPKPLRKRGRPPKVQRVNNLIAFRRAAADSADNSSSSAKLKASLGWESTDDDESLKGFPAALGDNLATQEKQPAELIIALPSNDDDSDSQIIFIDIDETTDSETKVQTASELQLQPKAAIATEAAAKKNNTDSPTRHFELIFPKAKQLETASETTPELPAKSKQQAETKPTKQPESGKDLHLKKEQLQVVEAPPIHIEPTKLWFVEGAKVKEEQQAQKADKAMEEQQVQAEIKEEQRVKEKQQALGQKCNEVKEEQQTQKADKAMEEQHAQIKDKQRAQVKEKEKQQAQKDDKMKEEQQMKEQQAQIKEKQRPQAQVKEKEKQQVPAQKDDKVKEMKQAQATEDDKAKKEHQPQALVKEEQLARASEEQRQTEPNLWFCNDKKDDKQQLQEQPQQSDNIKQEQESVMLASPNTSATQPKIHKELAESSVEMAQLLKLSTLADLGVDTLRRVLATAAMNSNESKKLTEESRANSCSKEAPKVKPAFSSLADKKQTNSELFKAAPALAKPEAMQPEEPFSVEASAAVPASKAAGTDTEQRELTKKKDQLELNKVKEQVELTKKKDQLELSKMKEQLELTKKKDQLELSKMKEQLELTKKKDQLEFNKMKEQLELTKKKDQLELNKMKEQLDLIKSKEQLELTKPKQQPELSKAKDQLELNKMKEQLDLIKSKEQLELTKPKQQPELSKAKEPATSASPKPEKPSSSSSAPSNVAFVECDALFKVLDKAQAQLRQEEQSKKKLKLAAKPPTTKQERSSQKKLPPRESTRRNTVCVDRQEEGAAALPLSYKRRNSVHPFKASPSPERATAADSRSSKKSSAKKPTKNKGALTKQLTSGHDELNSSSASIPPAATELEAADPLQDIAKFIEDGVKLLERDYKLESEQAQEQQQTNSTEAEFAQRVANMETPATTPTPSPAGSTEDLSLSGVRRSHRIKQKPKQSSGRSSSGSSTSSLQTPAISMEQQLSELAHIDSINEQFLRQEGLNIFQTLRDNYYRCARQVSKENAEMQCDCFVTGDEEGLGQLRCGDGCINRMLMIECGPLCTNGERCTNKRFQQHQGWPCRVFRTEKKGCGITAELQIAPGEFIMEYVGEVIDSEEFERRQHLYSKDRNRHYYFMALRGEAIIDATAKGNISRYINHSCDPNAETQKWTVNGELRIGFFTVKTIMPGEEITFDYQYQRYGRDAQRCYCESANCRGWIGNEPESDEGEGEQLDTDSDSELEELQPEQQQELEQEQKLKATRSIKKKQLKLSTARKQRKEQPKAKDREYKAGRWLRPTGSGDSGDKSTFGKPEQLEDPDVLEQLSLLSRSELKNQLDTLRFSRCMVRAKLLQSRLQLLGVLTRGELPCRRLFLDYHGLRLLHAWISESGSDKQLRLALLEALESLPIPNRTMLNDSRVYQSVELWSSQLESPSEADQELDALRQRISALLQKWQGLPEIFRIPKRERIEQMKEHEREADRQQPEEAAAAMPSSDRYRPDRFRRDTISSRYEKPKPAAARMSGNNTICTITTQPKEWPNAAESASGSKSDSRRRSEFDPRRTISKELRRSLFEKKVAQDEAEKRVGSEEWREHAARCEYFGADLNTDPKLLPHHQNIDTNEWFNIDNMPIPAPLRCGDGSEPPMSPEQDDDVEYRLPPHVEPLPASWHWSMTPEGDIYYYSLIDRIPQWEPPNAEQRLQQLVEDVSTEEFEEDEPVDPTDLIDVDVDYVGSLSAKSLAQYIESKVRERREIRRSMLTSVRVISPRREEDRLYNQHESRKYKENKEKIRRRKEIFRRARNDGNNPVPPADPTSDSLPIHSYLYSSDEDAVITSENLLPPFDASLIGKSSDSMHRRRPHSPLPKGKESPLSVKRRLPKEASDGLRKHHRSSERDKKRKTSTSAGRQLDASEKFQLELSVHVAECLRPFRQDNCPLGRITCEEDYKFLIKRLSHHITTKEMRYCDVTGNPLACTESVKHKSYDFIKQYMHKKGLVYKKPVDKPD